MRIREAMTDANAGPIGGEGGNLESDETYVGGKKKNAKGKPEPKKHAVHALVERGGHVRATHVADVTAKTLRSVMEKHADKRSTLHTDDGLTGLSIGKDFAASTTVNHTADEYYRHKDGAGIQSAEAFFAILKRGVIGSFHSISSSTCSATWTSSRSAGTTARRSASKTSSAPQPCSRASKASASPIGRLTRKAPPLTKDDRILRATFRRWMREKKKGR